MILFLIPAAKIFQQAKAYVSKDSPKQDGFCVVEFKLITASERTMVIDRDQVLSHFYVAFIATTPAEGCQIAFILGGAKKKC